MLCAPHTHTPRVRLAPQPLHQHQWHRLSTRLPLNSSSPQPLQVADRGMRALAKLLDTRSVIAILELQASGGALAERAGGGRGWANVVGVAGFG